MFKRALSGLLLAAAALTALPCLGVPNFFVVGLRGHEDEALRYCEGRPGCTVLRDKVREFENGNTFVRFLDPVVSRDVRILVPSVELTADQLMELLIKVRTARTNGARDILVETAATRLPERITLPGGAQVTVDLARMLMTAGVDSAVVHGRRVPLLSNAELIPAPSRPQETIISGDYHPQLRQELAEAAGLAELPYDELPAWLNGVQVLYLAPSVEPVNASFFKILGELQSLRQRGAEVVLVTPYLPYARTDKADQAGVTVTGRLVADLIEAFGANAVAFVRAHAPQSQGFFSVPVFHVGGRRTITDYLKGLGVAMVISPDAGFQKDATLYADELGVPVGVINKQRNLETGEAKLHDISGPSVAGKTVAVIDDETASGGTLAKAAEFLHKQGAARVYAVVTHLAGNPAKALSSPFIDELVVTNTLPATVGEGKIKVLSIGAEIARELDGYFPRGTEAQCMKVFQ